MTREERKRLREWAETQRTARADFGLAEQPMYAAVPALQDATEETKKVRPKSMEMWGVWSPVVGWMDVYTSKPYTSERLGHKAVRVTITPVKKKQRSQPQRKGKAK